MGWKDGHYFCSRDGIEFPQVKADTRRCPCDCHADAFNKAKASGQWCVCDFATASKEAWERHLQEGAEHKARG